MGNKAYMVGYSRGSWDETCYIDVFVTLDEELAKAWVIKANTKLEKIKESFGVHKYEEMSDTKQWSYDDGSEHSWNRFYELLNINNAFYKQINLR